ncbi:MAG: NIPSNAP family protein [Candidatus Binatia bacterium]
MLYLHETHEVSGGKMDEFERLLREQWVPLIEAGGSAKLLWFWHHTHGTGPSYQAITISAVRDWAAWGDLVNRSRRDAAWRDWYAAVWQYRREVISKLLLPTAWSPLQEVDFAAAKPSTDPSLSLYLHDTGWPYTGKLDDYAAALGSIFYPATRQSRMISVEACWTVCPGSGRFHEVVLLQKILDWDAFSHLLTSGERPARPSEWMQEGLKYRDRWESKLLRPASWSPLR